MKWRKLGMVFVPDGSLWWAKRRAYLPTPEVLEDETIRVYFSALDEDWVGRVGYVDLDAGDPTKILFKVEEPVLSVGERGAFDEHGVTPSCVLNFDGRKWLYYYGWQRVQGVPPLMFTGLAFQTRNDIGFRRWKRVPILDRTDREPLGRAGSFVLRDWTRGARYRMWYNARKKWLDVSGNPLFDKEQAVYDIQCVESPSGTGWSPNVRKAVTFKGHDEFGLARPWVLKEADGLYRMWYSIRTFSRPYCLGYAESWDGIFWNRKDDEVGIEKSDDGWDSEMICFAAVVDAGGERYMFYDGNKHGETGFGAAVLEQD